MSQGYSERELYSMYEDFLDEVYGTVEVAGMHYDTSRILKATDPIAYREGFCDWLNSSDFVEDPSGQFDYVRTEDSEA